VSADLKFDVVSVRRSGDGTRLSFRRTPTGDVIITSMPLAQIVIGSYPAQQTPIKGLPDWTRTERYDITAKAFLAKRPTVEQERLMRQALLVDRFQFAAHVDLGNA
jgi:uncharacterized protein (TIGR03435 family)